MYKNTGPKIIAVANIITGICIVLSILSGIILLIMSASTGSGIIGVLIALLVAGFGCVIAWVSNLLIAGFGELVSNSHAILVAVTGRSQLNNSDSSTPAQPTQTISNQPTVIPEPIVKTSMSTHEALYKRGLLSLEDGEWDKADKLFEQSLEIDPENAKIYIGKLCVELSLHNEEDLIKFESSIDDYTNFKRALQFADESYRKTLELYSLTPKEQEERKEQIDAELATFEKFVKDAREMNTAREIYDEFLKRNLNIPESQKNDIESKLKGSVNVERTHGNNKSSAIKYLNDINFAQYACSPHRKTSGDFVGGSDKIPTRFPVAQKCVTR